jgi:hypothetical protein
MSPGGSFSRSTSTAISTERDRVLCSCARFRRKSARRASILRMCCRTCSPNWSSSAIAGPVCAKGDDTACIKKFKSKLDFREGRVMARRIAEASSSSNRRFATCHQLGSAAIGPKTKLHRKGAPPPAPSSDHMATALRLFVNPIYDSFR